MQARFYANLHKTLEVVLWLSDELNGTDFHQAAKLVFYADKYHLNRYGRPVVGGDYDAKEHGPVSLPLYDVMRGDPWTWQAVERNGKVPLRLDGFRVYGTRGPNLDLLSDSDVEALRYAVDQYGSCDFDMLTELSHEEPAWKCAVGRQMAYEDFLEDTAGKAERERHIAEVSRRIAL